MLFKINERLNAYNAPVGFSVQVAKTTTYPIMFPFPVFVAQFYHSPLTLRADRRTDGRHGLCEDRRPLNETT